jgi:tetratricopeptide (TPR) repeat protein
LTENNADEARTHFEAALVIAEQVLSTHGVINATRSLAELAVQTGDFETAANQFMEVVDLAAVIRAPRLAFDCLAQLGNALQALGRAEESIVVLSRAAVLGFDLGEGLLPMVGWILLHRLAPQLKALRNRDKDWWPIVLQSGAAVLLRGQPDVPEAIDQLGGRLVGEGRAEQVLSDTKSVLNELGNSDPAPRLSRKE